MTIHGASPGALLSARALAEAIFSTESGAPPSDRLDWLMREFDDFLGRMGTRGRVLLLVSLFAVSWLAPLLTFRLRPLRSLALAARVEALERLERSRAAMPLLATKAILSLLYYEHPDAAREIGFDGACLRAGSVTPVVLGREQTSDVSVACDVVVVGSGASGAVVATELAEAGQDVVVLEEGPHVPPESYGKMRPSETLRHMWRDGGTTFAIGLGDSPVINVMMGRCVGGSSVLTGGVCFRIPDDVLAEWVRDHGLTDMTPEGMAPCFEAVERAMHVEEVPVAMRSRSTTLFVNGARKLGFEMSPIRRNTKGCNGCGRCNFGCPHGAKQSVDVSYLPRARANGARVYSDCLAEELLLDGERAVGVRGRFLDGPRAGKTTSFTVRARRVVVACGAYHSPLLLRRSGIGRRSEQVGRNLTLHPSFRVMARFDEPVHGWKGALQSAWSDRFHDDRITLTGLFTPPGVLAATMPGIGTAHAERARAVPHMAVFGGLIHDRGSGVVRRGLGREPIVTYRMAKEDRAAIPVLMRKMAEVFFAGGAREVFLPILGAPSVKPDDLATLDLSHIPATRLECASQHPLGTCRMGTSPYRSVVKPDGETWDVKDLYVVDGSVLPTSLGVNPQVSVMAVATKLAWGMREKRLPG